MSPDPALYVLLWFASLKHLAFVLMVLTSVVTVYLGEECGFPRFHSERLTHAYARLVLVVTMTVGLACLVLLMLFSLVLAMAT